MQNFNQKIIYFLSEFILCGRSKIGKKGKLQNPKANDLMLTKYANKKQVKIAHIHTFLLPQVHSYQ